MTEIKMDEEGFIHIVKEYGVVEIEFDAVEFLVGPVHDLDRFVLKDEDGADIISINGSDVSPADRMRLEEIAY